MIAWLKRNAVRLCGLVIFADASALFYVGATAGTAIPNFMLEVLGALAFIMGVLGLGLMKTPPREKK